MQEQQCQSSTCFTDIFPLSENVVNFNETLQPHEYYWLQAIHMATLYFIYTIWTMGMGVFLAYIDLVLFPFWFKGICIHSKYLKALRKPDWLSCHNLQT